MTNFSNNNYKGRNCAASGMSTSSHLMLLLGVLLLVSAVTSSPVEPRPVRSKRSGISDQRLAELETLVALSNMRGRVVTVPVAYGIIDPARIGKRKRSYDHTVVSDETGALLGRLMQRVRSELSGMSESAPEVDEDLADMLAEE